MVSVGVVGEPVNQAYDVISTLALILNLLVSVLNTFDSLNLRFGGIFSLTEKITVAIFAIDYFLRLITAPLEYPKFKGVRAGLRYVFSLMGIIDLLSFLPFYLPVFFPTGTAVFRMFRVARILRLFRINAYYDSLNVIIEVIASKSSQLGASIFVIAVLMLASSLCMYSLEHEAQPEVFENAFSGIWWATSTLLTVGYGDIYPITTAGKVVGIFLSFLGVGVVAIPTGIISAGFVEQYSRLKRLGDYAEEMNISFIRIEIGEDDIWNGKRIKDLGLPHNTIIAVIIRGKQTIIPKGETVIQPQDAIIIGSEATKGHEHIELKEIVLKENHPWNNKAISDIDISRKSVIIMIRRNDRTIIPKGKLVLKKNDTVYIYHSGETESK